MGYRIETREDGRIVHVAAIVDINGKRHEYDRNTPDEAMDLVDRLDASVREDQTLLSFFKFVREHLDCALPENVYVHMRPRMNLLVAATEATIPDVLLENLSTRHIRAIHDKLIATGRTMKTLYGDIGAVGQLLDLAIEQGRLEKNVARVYAKGHLRRPADRVPDLPRADPTDLIIPRLSESGKIGYGLIRRAGLTALQMGALRWSDVDFSYPALKVSHTLARAQDPVPTSVVMTRTIPLEAGAFLDQLEALYNLAEDKVNGFVVTVRTKKGGFFRPQKARVQVVNEIVSAQMELGIKSLVTGKPYLPTTFRDLCIVDWLNRPQPNYVKLQAQAGYADTSTFMRRFQPFIRIPDASVIIERALSAMAEMR